MAHLYNDVGQAAVGLGHAAVTVSKAGVVGIEILKNKTPTKLPSKLSQADIKKILTSATTPYKGSTVIGHALSKHAGRNPEIWGKMEGATNTWNTQAMMHLKEVIRAYGEFEKTKGSNGIDFLEKRLPDGRGVRLNLDRTFKGFID